MAFRSLAFGMIETFVSLRLKFSIEAVSCCPSFLSSVVVGEVITAFQAITPSWFAKENCNLATGQDDMTKQSLVITVIVDLYNNLYARPFAATLTDNLARKTRGPEWRSKQPI